jgi:hypothetical protein
MWDNLELAVQGVRTEQPTCSMKFKQHQGL